MKAQELESIEICYENVEHLSIPAKYISSMQMEGYERRFEHNRNGSRWKEFFDDVYIVITKDVLEDYDVLDNMYVKKYKDKSKWDIRKELLRNDVTHINLKFKNGVNFDNSVPWTGDSDYYNDAVTVTELSNGNFLLVATRGDNPQFNKYIKSIKDFQS